MLDGSMAMSFQALNCPSHLVGSINKHRTQHFNIKSPSPSFVVKSSSSIVLSVDENDFPKSKDSSLSFTPLGNQTARPILSHVNTVGIIGGVSPISTLSFLKKLVGWSTEQGEESIPFILCSDPLLNKEFSSHERASVPYLNSKSDRFHLDSTLIVENLRQQRVFLEESGARCIVMPCHISHSWYAEVFEGCSVPFLHVGDCVAKELKEANLKPIEAGSNVRIGVLAADATLTMRFYMEKLQNQGFEVVLPDRATMEHTMIPAIEALNRKDIEGARNLLRIALQVLLVMAVNTVILPSDDLRNLLPRDDPLLKKCIDPLDALARATIQWAKSMETVQNT